MAVLFLVTVFLSFPVSAKENGKSLKTPPPANPDIIRGIECLYNWKFEKAGEFFERIIRKNPHEPAGYFYRSMVIWSRMAAGFWSAETIEEYNNSIELTISVAKERIERDKADSTAYFYLGGALGFKGRLQLMQHKFFSSYLVSRDAIDALNTCLKMEPENRDILLGLGIYDYYTSRLSGVLRFLSNIFFHKGDRHEGLRKLHVAANEAMYSFLEAKSVLLYIYLFLESDFTKARPLAEELAEKFDGCPKYGYLKGVTYIKLGMNPHYRQTVDYLYRRSRIDSSPIDSSIWRSWGRYLEVSYFLSHDRYEAAISILNDILNHKDPLHNPYMSAWPLLKLGMVCDIKGEREKALEYYRNVLNMHNAAGAQFLAEKFIRRAALRQDPLLFL